MWHHTLYSPLRAEVFARFWRDRRQVSTPDGTFLGVGRHGVLVAMAGERLHPVGWTELSAVCTV
jgi:hypothetical protein